MKNGMQHKAFIFKPTKNPMQSGTANVQHWVLEFTSDDRKFVEPLMGWVGSKDTTRQIKLRFPSQAEAVAYAEEHQIPYEIRNPNQRVVKPKSYTSNFAANRRKYSDKI